MAAPHTTLFVRAVHVAAVTVVLGGAALAYTHLRNGPREVDGDSHVVTLLAGYERLFWVAAGVLVVTGVGNLGALSPRLPGGVWGAVLTVKLLVVLAGLGLSLVRTLLVERYHRHATEWPTRPLRAAYAATALGLSVLLALAEVLAHG